MCIDEWHIIQPVHKNLQDNKSADINKYALMRNTLKSTRTENCACGNLLCYVSHDLELFLK